MGTSTQRKRRKGVEEVFPTCQNTNGEHKPGFECAPKEEAPPETPQVQYARRGRKVVRFLHERRGRTRGSGAEVAMYATESPENVSGAVIPGKAFQTGPDKVWAIHCHTHGQTGYVRTTTDGYKVLTSPEIFCTGCKEAVSSRSASPAPVVVTEDAPPPTILEFSLPGGAFNLLPEDLREGLKVGEKANGVGSTYLLRATTGDTEKVLASLEGAKKGTDRNTSRTLGRAIDRVKIALQEA